MGDSCASTFQWAFLSGVAIFWAFGSKAPVSNPRDNAIYSHWYMKSNHHPADVPSCGRLCSKEQNQDCEVKDLKVKEGAEFKCTGHQMKRTKVNSTDPTSTSDFRIELVCLCKRSTVVRKPGKLCGPVGTPPCNDTMTWVDGINTMIEDVQGQDFRVLLHNRTEMGFTQTPPSNTTKD